MTLARFSLASAMLHAGAFLLFGALASHQAPAHVETDAWMIDLKTVLAATEHDSEATLPRPVQQAPELPGKGSVEETIPAVPDPSPVLHHPASVREEVQASQAVANGGNSKTEGAALLQSPQIWSYPNTMAPQAIIAQLQAYRAVASKTVSGLLAGKISESEGLDDATGIVRVSFADGAIGSVSVDARNKLLDTILRTEVDWSLVPPPRSFHLPISQVVYSVRIHDRKLTVVTAPI